MSAAAADLLAKARAALAANDTKRAARAAAKVVALDPSNDAAKELLLRAEFSSTVKATNMDKCWNCKTDCSVDMLQWCAACNVVAYCSRECQRKDSKAHKPGCKKAQEQLSAAKA